MTTSDPAPVPSGLSALFSLSQVAASVPPMPVSASTPAQAPAMESASAKDRAARRHRRLSSSDHNVLAPLHAAHGRRKQSDARDAGALLALSTLSLSSSGLSAPTVTTNLHSHDQEHSTTNTTTSLHPDFKSGGVGMNVPGPRRGTHNNQTAIASSVPTPYMNRDVTVDVEEDFDDGASVAESVTSRPGGKPSSRGTAVKKPRKRGTIHQCESCSKVYRHQSCLSKHRWEHSPHWHEASKFFLSKHQQVQLLEAAAVLTHLGPGSSLPDDRSLWPSYISGGLLPPPSSSADAMSTPSVRLTTKGRDGTGKPQAPPYQPVSSSVPTRRVSRAISERSVSGGGQGPKLYDYSLKTQTGNSSSTSLTQIRPGLLGRPTAPASFGSVGTGNGASSKIDIREDERIGLSKTMPMNVPISGSMFAPQEVTEAYKTVGYRETTNVTEDSYSSAGASISASANSWGGPRSALRSVSESISGSGEDEEEEGDESVGLSAVAVAGHGFSGRRTALKQQETAVRNFTEEDEWGVEVNMEMEVDF